MPSIPQSLLWISLVVLWLFVLVPMLINKRDAVRRTSDVALATRVLNGSAASRLLRRTGPATGHRRDPHWKPEGSDDYDDDVVDEADADAEVQPRRTSRSVVVMAAVIEETESEYLDVDVVDENSGALTAAADDAQTDVIEIVTEKAEPTVDDVRAEDAPEPEDAEPEPEASKPEPEASKPEVAAPPPDRDRRRGNQIAAAAKVAARKYEFRRRMITALVLGVLASGVAAFTVAPAMWWVCGTVFVITVLYLAYLRRQTRIEERLRRRRQQRMARARLGVENTRDPEFDVTPSRLRRPGAAVLEIDDEDPIFEHLEYASAVSYDLARASGQ
ncbi:MAG: divisome protein SepX/GlpR [Mycobacterium sp.]